MEKVNIDMIAKQAGVSRSTVSKALNNCVSVDRNVKNRIVDLAKKYNYTSKQQQRSKNGFTLGIVMPINPYYFWNEAIKGMNEASLQADPLIDCRYSLYSNLSNEDDILYCLEYIEDMDVDAFVVVPVNTPKVQAKLKQMSGKRPLFFLNEQLDIENIPYIGADCYQDGRLLAKQCLTELRTHNKILMISSGSQSMVHLRDKGFLDEASAYIPDIEVVAEVSIEYDNMISAKLSRIINSQYKDAFSCIYVSQGFLPQVCRALHKLKLHKKVLCIGYENPKLNREYINDGTIHAFLEQNIYEQGYRCAQTVADYLMTGSLPAEKSIFIQSKCFINNLKEEKNMKKVKIGVFGAYRGKCMIETVTKYPDAELVAICDKYEPLLRECEQIAKDNNSEVALYTNFEDFFNHDMDAVILSNYAHEHAPYAIRLLKSGRHVASEVLPTKNMAEAVELVEAVEESGKVYAYLENYCYFPATTEMRKLYKSGVLGHLVHAEGEYIHNCEKIWIDITYGERSHWRNNTFSTFYCTHSLGPIVHITGCRPVKVIGIEAPPTERMMKLGMPKAEGAMEIIQMDNGAMVKSVHGNLIREPGSIWYSLYGSKGMAESDRWTDGVQKINVYEDASDELKTYNPTPDVDSELAKAVKTHGGGDFYTVHYFVQKILGRPEGEESIDVYEALDMSTPGILAYRSICSGNIPIDVPNFRNKEEREAYRNDTWSAWGEGENNAYISGKPKPEIPDEVYENARKIWLERQKDR